MFDVKIKTENYNETLKRIAVAISHPLPFLKTWGNSVAKKARANARAKGGRRFWGEIAQSTRLHSVDNKHAVVVADHRAAAQKEFGGTIRPKRAKALTIPIAPEARGKHAADFESHSLFVLKTDNMKPETRGILGYAENGKFHGLFVLRTKVVQAPDPFWPKKVDIMSLGKKAAEFWLKQQMKVSQ